MIRQAAMLPASVQAQIQPMVRSGDGGDRATGGVVSSNSVVFHAQVLGVACYWASTTSLGFASNFVDSRFQFCQATLRIHIEKSDFHVAHFPGRIQNDKHRQIGIVISRIADVSQ